MAQKILELINEDWIKGISGKKNFPEGGLFQDLSGCDPFEESGLAMPSLTGDTITPSGTIKVMTNWNNGTTGYIYGHADTKLYQYLNTSPYTETDVTAQITARTQILNAKSWAGYYVYIPTSVSTTDVRSNVYPVASGSDYQMFNGVLQVTGQDFVAMGMGADGNLYIGSQQKLFIMTSPTDSTKNTGVFNIDNGFNIRDICNDGRYLVVVADNNQLITTQRQVGYYRCRVYFWDMVKSQNSGAFILPDVIWDLDDSYLVACRQLDDGYIYVIGYNGIYRCTSAKRPALLRAFVGSGAVITARPNNANQVVVSKGSIYWIEGLATSGTNIGAVFAYGNPVAGQTKIFYKPYLNGGNNIQQTCMTVMGQQFWIANATPNIYVQNTGSVRGQVAMQTLDSNMKTTYTYAYTKVVLAQELASGQSVLVQVFTAQGSGVISQETKSYNAADPKQTLLFRKGLVGVVGQLEDKFEDISVRVVTSGGAALARVTTYATPIEDGNEIV